ncbi:MAG: VWA domain-containing protein [Anaerolineae bacterium]|nr:VWA domain-containing protein [Anaerolineae bacterium]
MMDKRMVDFIRALRAAGVRISVAESQDALFGVNAVGIQDMARFRSTLKSTLVKEQQDQPRFDYYFPLFFSHNEPPMNDIQQQLTPEQQQMLQQALDTLMGDMDALRQMLQQLLNGQSLSGQQLQELGQQAGLNNGDEMYQRAWFERRMNQMAGMNQIMRMLDDLLEQLAEMGMSQEDLNRLEAMLRENMQGMSDQISQFTGASLAERMSEKPPEPKPDLLDVPFQRLSQQDLDTLRDEIRRLAARLRTRAAMRQRRARTGNFDPRKTLRSNMRYLGVPVEMKFRKRQRKPSLVLICDLSTSMRYCVEFLLTLVYELQDQVQRTSSFIFISDLKDVTMDLEEHDSQVAVEKVLRENPPGYYSTDLGNSLNSFARDHMSRIDHRTTVIILGDGRNNYNNPRIDIASDMQKRARRLFWFCPETPAQWGSGDSDMHLYATRADGVLLVRNLRQLADAVDSILAES